MSERRRILELFEKNRDYIGQRSSEGIEKYRKGDMHITVSDAQGAPVKGAQVKVKQKNHAFRFGANLFMLDELETPEKNAMYKQRFTDVFNMATLPFYWDALEPKPGQLRFDKNSPRVYRRPAIDLCMEFCQKHGIEPREHALAYDAFFPEWLKDCSVDEVKKALETRFAQIAQRYAHLIPTIEVTNEMDRVQGKTSFYDHTDYVRWCFETARKYFPENKLCINEGTRLSWTDNGRAFGKYYSYLEANLLKGAPIDAIGLQYHTFYPQADEYERSRKTYDPINLYHYMDLYSELGKPLQITEITIPAYSNEPEDEAIQAEILNYLYPIWFSHPNVEQIVYWNLVDGYAHLWTEDWDAIRASQGNMTLGENVFYGGLLRFDLSPKPAYEALKTLICQTWRTEETAVTDENGQLSFRGFFGDYEAEITAGGIQSVHSLTLQKEGEKSVLLTL